MEQPGLLRTLDVWLTSGVDPSRLLLEITETALTVDGETTMQALHADTGPGSAPRDRRLRHRILLPGPPAICPSSARWSTTAPTYRSSRRPWHWPGDWDSESWPKVWRRLSSSPTCVGTAVRRLRDSFCRARSWPTRWGPHHRNPTVGRPVHRRGAPGLRRARSRPLGC